MDITQRDTGVSSASKEQFPQQLRSAAKVFPAWLPVLALAVSGWHTTVKAVRYTTPKSY